MDIKLCNYICILTSPLMKLTVHKNLKKGEH